MESTPNPFALSPNTHILIDTSETPAAPNARVSGPESHIPSLRQAASHKHVVQRPELNNASRPPSYYANSPLWDPFRDGDAPTGYFYTGNTGMQNGSNSATAAYIVPVPTTTAPLLDPIKRVPSANTNPFLGEMPLDEELPPLLPPRPCNFERGLQIPSRVSLITWGFSFPEILAEQGINKEQWRSFKHELESFARLGIFDIITMIGTQMIVSHFFGVIPGEDRNVTRGSHILLTLSQVFFLPGTQRNAKSIGIFGPRIEAELSRLLKTDGTTNTSIRFTYMYELNPQELV